MMLPSHFCSGSVYIYIQRIDCVYSYFTDNTREPGSKSLVQGNVFHFLMFGLTKKAVRVCSVKVPIICDWWSCYFGLLLRTQRRRSLQVVFISLWAKFDFHSKTGEGYFPAAIWAWAVPGQARSREVRVMVGRLCFLLTTLRANRRNDQGEATVSNCSILV